MVIVVTGIKRLFWWLWFYLVSDIYLLKCFSYVFWKAKEFEVIKWFVNIFVLFLIEKCAGYSILVKANLFLAI